MIPAAIGRPPPPAELGQPARRATRRATRALSLADKTCRQVSEEGASSAGLFGWQAFHWRGLEAGRPQIAGSFCVPGRQRPMRAERGPLCRVSRRLPSASGGGAMQALPSTSNPKINRCPDRRTQQNGRRRRTETQIPINQSNGIRSGAIVVASPGVGGAGLARELTRPARVTQHKGQPPAELARAGLTTRREALKRVPSLARWPAGQPSSANEFRAAGADLAPPLKVEDTQQQGERVRVRYLRGGRKMIQSIRALDCF
jgi:hypothetical protein